MAAAEESSRETLLSFEENAMSNKLCADKLVTEEIKTGVKMIDIKMINPVWQPALCSFNFTPVTDKIKTTSSPVYPPKEKIFNCLNRVNTQDVKVVIIGQDPYHGKDQATGYCFGYSGSKIPPSLKNIEKELKSDIGVELIDKTLEHWADQGVLLLNTSLTVEEGKANSHSKIWKGFAKLIIDHLNENYQNIIFVAWGAHAFKCLEGINTDKHKLIVSSHPSPLSANKSFGDYPPFLGSKPFSKINEYLTEKIKF